MPVGIGVPKYYVNKLDGIAGMLTGVMLLLFSIYLPCGTNAPMALFGIVFFIAGIQIFRTRSWKKTPIKTADTGWSIVGHLIFAMAVLVIFIIAFFLSSTLCR